MTKTENLTELVFILDKSGSMAGLEGDTIGGFNAMIEKQKKLSGKCFVSTIAFNDKSDVIHDRVKLENIRPMTHDDYFVGGCTALIDALGGAIKHIANIHKYARKEDIPQNTMFVITTDGMENASRKYTAEKVKAMIEEKKAKGWEFLFIGANIDAVTTAENYGIRPDRAVNYHADKKGTKVVYNAVANAVCNMRTAAPVGDSWRQDIDADFNSRRKS
ncbi:MAG: VWA domain-containing protein [Clostridia bacterium]|nr:VWA domain-containing protein [Clostridia bacterium]